jgi:hypothetical protein
MKRIQLIVLVGVGLAFLLTACKKPYEPPEIKVITNFLVVDGTISCGTNAITTITLSRTKRLNDSILFNPELDAAVYIDGEAGGSYVLDKKGDGVYQSQPLNLPPGQNYRLRIDVNGKEYLSSYSLAKTSPAIDSVTWRQEEDAVIYVHTHDPANSTRYYRWDYTETWNYESIYSTAWGVKDGMIFPKDATTQTDSCWRTANSTNLLVGSSVALTDDMISYFPVATIPRNDEKLSKRYSILVRQYAITDEAFRYLQLIQKNTEQLGTLFDGQPSQLEGNIHATDNPNEPVIGFITASTMTEKRIFIKNTELSGWNYIPAGAACNDMFVIERNPVDFRIWTYPDPAYTIYYFPMAGGIMVGRKVCLECTALGGANVKPSFW